MKSTRSANPVTLSFLDTAHLYVDKSRRFSSRRNNEVSYFAIQMANARPHGNDVGSRICTLVNHPGFCQCGPPQRLCTISTKRKSNRTPLPLAQPSFLLFRWVASSMVALPTSVSPRPPMVGKDLPVAYCLAPPLSQHQREFMRVPATHPWLLTPATGCG